MELWELNHCIWAYSRRQAAKNKNETVLAWQIAAFTGASLAGKLKKPKHYLPETGPGTTAPKISKEQFEEGLKGGKA